MTQKTLQIISDIHTEFGIQPEKFRSLLTKADITVLAGDIVNNANKLTDYLLITKEFSNYIIYVIGNHEYYKESSDTDYQKICESIPGVFFLQRSRINVDGLWFTGCTLWTEINDKAKVMMNDPFLAQEIRDMHEIDVKWLNENAKEGDIIVTHHLPSFHLIHPKYSLFKSLNTGFASNLDWLILKIKPLIWIAGHTHTPFDTEVCGTRFIINPVGYPGENTFSKKIITINTETNTIC
jgi:predicted phosphodiesterase